MASISDTYLGFNYTAWFFYIINKQDFQKQGKITKSLLVQLKNSIVKLRLRINALLHI